MAKHGVYVQQQATSLSTPVVADSGLPYAVGTAPVWTAEDPAPAGVPVLCTSYDEAVQHFGYSDDWETYTLCEFMYSHFRLYNCQPVIFCNVLDAQENQTEVPAADTAFTAHKIILPHNALPETIVLKPEGGEGTAYAKDTDYIVFFKDDTIIVEAVPEGVLYSVTTVNLAYSTANTSSVDDNAIADGIAAVDQCVTLFGTIPDLICAPGFSHKSSIAALMAAKAGGINEMFRAKALIDLDAMKYTDAVTYKNEKNMVDENQIVCWPMLSLGDKKFHMSTQLAGLLASLDTTNNNVPYESPSNKSFQCDGAVLADGTPVNLTKAQVDVLDNNGIMTALRFFSGWTCWGNHTACYPSNTDPKDNWIPVSRMFGWVGTTLIRTFWSKIDQPMVRRVIDNIMDTANIWMNGLTSMGYILGGRIEFQDGENPTTNLLSGILQFHIYITPPVPLQEMEFVLEYDTDYFSELFA